MSEVPRDAALYACLYQARLRAQRSARPAPDAVAQPDGRERRLALRPSALALSSNAPTSQRPTTDQRPTTNDHWWRLPPSFRRATSSTVPISCRSMCAGCRGCSARRRTSAMKCAVRRRRAECVCTWRLRRRAWRRSCWRWRDQASRWCRRATSPRRWRRCRSSVLEQLHEESRAERDPAARQARLQADDARARDCGVEAVGAAHAGRARGAAGGRPVGAARAQRPDAGRRWRAARIRVRSCRCRPTSGSRDGSSWNGPSRARSRCRSCSRACSSRSRLRLERRDRGAAVLHVTLGLVTKEDHHCRLELPSPLRDVRALRTLALLDCEAHPPSAAIDTVTVIIEPTPGRILQHALFARPHPTPEQLSTLLARLGARDGAGAGRSACRARFVSSWRLCDDAVCHRASGGIGRADTRAQRATRFD